LVLLLSLSCALAAVVVLSLLLLPLEFTELFLLRKEFTSYKTALVVASLVSLALCIYSCKILSNLDGEADQAALWRNRFEVFGSVVALFLFLLVCRIFVIQITNARQADRLDRLQRERERERKGHTSLREAHTRLTEGNLDLRRQLDEACRMVASLQAIQAQAKNQQSEYMRLMDDNVSLMQLVERLDAQKEELISQMLAKKHTDKKKD